MMTLRELFGFNLFLLAVPGYPKNLSQAIFDLKAEEGAGAAENVLNDGNVALDDMMECASPTALEAIAVLRDELKLANQDFMVQQ